MRLITGIILLTFFAACEEKREVPSDLLTKDKMVNVLVDFQLAEAKLIELRISADSGILAMDELELEIYENHGITDSVYTKSYAYYLEHLEMMEEIYEAVVDSLSLREKIKKF